MTFHRSILRIVTLAVAVTAATHGAAKTAPPLALLVESEALGGGTTGTVMGIVLALAPEDLERAGEYVRVVTTLQSSGATIDRQSAVIRVGGDGSIMLYRDWPVGLHTLEVAVNTLDGSADGFWVGDMEVPERRAPFEAPEGAEVEALALSLTSPATGAVRFRPPPDRGGIGALQLEVEAPEQTASVEFFENGASLFRRNRPPWTASISLGEIVRRTQIRAVARDKSGAYLGEDALILNSPTGQIGIEILLAPEDSITEGRRQVTVAVSPGEGRIHQVLLSLDERAVARWVKCPCVTTIPVTDLETSAIIAAEAVDSAGRRGDRVLALGGSPGFSGTVQVELVELPITVLDGRRSPVSGLERNDFRILEDGLKVTIEGFGTFDDLPLSLALAVDTSGSMVEDFPAVLEAAEGFTTELMKAGDEVVALTFAWEPIIRLGWTQDPRAVSTKLERITPEGGTSLHDAVVRSLEQFRGRRGRQALVLLTDGEDTTSRTGWVLAERFAQTMRVPIFPIGLGLGRMDYAGRKTLRLLAEATGGEAFFPKTTKDLDDVYRRIGILLRSQYLVWYSSQSVKSAESFRRVEVTAPGRPEVTIRTISGYYPGR